MSESDAAFVERMRQPAYTKHPRGQEPGAWVLCTDLARLCDLAERQIDVRAAVRTLIQRTETAETQCGSVAAKLTALLDDACERANQMRQRAETAEALASELAAALSTIREMCGCNDACCPICHLAAHGSAPGRPTIDALLATDAGKAALARREREQAVIEAARAYVAASAAWAANMGDDEACQKADETHDALSKAVDALAAQQQQQAPE